jgi:ribosomal protein S18 acetylase RimI-like enzyme
MRVRLLENGDEATLVAAARVFNDIEMPRVRAAELLSDSTFVMVVAENDRGDLVGRIYGHVLNRLDQSDLFLYEVDVVESQRRRGAGRAMVDFLKKFCSERGYGEMFVPTECSNIEGNGLYRSTGGVAEGSPANIYVWFTSKT